MIRIWGETGLAIGVYTVLLAIFGAQPSIAFGVIAMIVGVLCMIFGTPAQEGE